MRGQTYPVCRGLEARFAHVNREIRMIMQLSVTKIYSINLFLKRMFWAFTADCVHSDWQRYFKNL